MAYFPNIQVSKFLSKCMGLIQTAQYYSVNKEVITWFHTKHPIIGLFLYVL